MAIRVLHNSILVKPDGPRDPRSDSGKLYLPQTTEPKLKEGTVVAAGDGRPVEGGRIEMDVKVGDRVAYISRAGTEIVDNGERFLIMNETDVLAILDPAPVAASV